MGPFIMSYVYAYIDLAVEKMRYVGKGTDGRDLEHLGLCTQPSCPKTAWYGYLRNMVRDGIEFIIVRLLDNVSDEEAYRYEKETIKRVGRKIYGTGPLLNITEGGLGNVGGGPMSQETRRKISEATKGKKRTEETKRRMSVARMGYSPTLETCEKIRQAKMGMKASQETKDKLSKARKGMIFTQEHKNNLSRALMGHYVSLESIEKSRKGNLGKKRTMEQREQMRERQIGKKHTQATKDKIGRASKGRVSPMKGKHHSEETRDKIGRSRKLAWVRRKQLKAEQEMFVDTLNDNQDWKGLR